MSTVAEIEAAIRRLSEEEQRELLSRFEEEAWDRQIAADAASGRLDDLIAEVESDIAGQRVKPLHEVLDNS